MSTSSAASARFSHWVSEHCGLHAAVQGERLSGGNSNVTELVITGTGRAVLRRPPDAALSASAANGVRREFRVLRALEGQARAPRALGLCEDANVIGQPFVLTEFVDGVSIRDRLPDSYLQYSEPLTSVGFELVDALADVHRVDWRGIGLSASAPHDYVPRQVERWLHVRTNDAVRALPALERVAAWLLRELPVHRPAALIHGDYHLDNTLFDRSQPVLRAIIDWELATVGDPLADLALMLAFWGPRPIPKPGFDFVQRVTRSASVVPRETLAERWASKTGISTDGLQYYRVFALWRLAAIVEGAYALYCRGQVSDDYSRHLEHDVPALLKEAETLVQMN
jgi:aminoglycoside phosphotransferase (APT) family kinase protein